MNNTNINLMSFAYLLLIAFVWYRTTFSENGFTDLLVKTLVALAGGLVWKGLICGWFV